MGGREDYQERKEARIERYKKLSLKAKEELDKRVNSTANRILASTPRSTNYIRSSFRKNGKTITR